MLPVYKVKIILKYFSPDEALMALAVMHNYAPEQYKVCKYANYIGSQELDG